MRTTLEIPTVLCFIHLSEPTDFVRYELPFCPFIGMDIMDRKGNMYTVKRVVFDLHNQAINVYCKEFEKVQENDNDN